MVGGRAQLAWQWRGDWQPDSTVKIVNNLIILKIITFPITVEGSILLIWQHFICHSFVQSKYARVQCEVNVTIML